MTADPTATPLHDLARALGVDVEFDDWEGRHQTVTDASLRAVLGAMGQDADDPRAALERHRAEESGRTLPPYVVAREGERTAVPTLAAEVRLVREDGSATTLAASGGEVVLPDHLPVGYHELVADGRRTAVIRTPHALALPERLRERPGWGFAVQLYSVRSRASWGTGDLGDLAELARWSAREHGADFVLVNPLHAAEVVAPMQPSPYLPTTRRFANPLYLRVEDVPEHADLDADARARVAALADRARAATDGAALLDRDAVWAAKREALELVHAVTPSAERAAAFAAFRDRSGRTLDDFARWCALSEVHGNDPAAWPDDLRDADAPGVAGFTAEHADRITFHAWLQWLLDDQLAAAQRAARDAGMAVGIVHDLAVGVSPTGADAWSRHDQLATTVTVGAPPDAYSQTGQDWGQPPWRPDRLAASGFAPFRDLAEAALRHAGGLRVDHVLGLFRLWWIPGGKDARDGTYVRYDHHAMVGVLTIEAARRGAVLIGEDLGTVAPGVREHLAARGVLGTSILWFETEDGAPLPPERWRELCLASVTTHDLPPTTGYLAGDHVRLRHDLGLLTRGYDEELAADRADQQRWLDVLRDRGLIGDDPAPEDVVLALHTVLGAAPSVLRCAALTDAVGERRTQNQPGTTQEQYPNWRIPLAGPDGRPVLLEDLADDPRVTALAAAMRGEHRP